jgi:hypothetical protein
MFVPARRSRISSAMFGSEARNALGMVPSASMANAQAATSSVEEIARRAFCDGSRSLGGALRVRVAMWPNRSRARVALCAVAASGLKPSSAAFNRLRP